MLLMLSWVDLTVVFFGGSGDRVCSLSLDVDVVVVRRDPPVLAVVVLVGEVLLVVSEEGVELEALLEVLGGLEAADVLEHVEVTLGIGASVDKAVPVDALQLDVGVVLLVVETHGAAEA